MQVFSFKQTCYSSYFVAGQNRITTQVRKISIVVNSCPFGLALAVSVNVGPVYCNGVCTSWDGIFYQIHSQSDDMTSTWLWHSISFWKIFRISWGKTDLIKTVLIKSMMCIFLKLTQVFSRWWGYPNLDSLKLECKCFHHFSAIWPDWLLMLLAKTFFLCLHNFTWISHFPISQNSPNCSQNILPLFKACRRFDKCTDFYQITNCNEWYWLLYISCKFDIVIRISTFSQTMKTLTFHFCTVFDWMKIAMSDQQTQQNIFTLLSQIMWAGN